MLILNSGKCEVYHFCPRAGEGVVSVEIDVVDLKPRSWVSF